MQVIEKVKVVSEGYNGAGMNYDGCNRRDVNGKANAGLTLGIIGTALGVTNLDRRVTTNYNAKAEFFNNYYFVWFTVKIECFNFNHTLKVKKGVSCAINYRKTP